MNDLHRSPQRSTSSLTKSTEGHASAWEENQSTNALDLRQNAISLLLQPPVVQTGDRQHSNKSTSSLYTKPTARDIEPVVLTTIPVVEFAGFQPYLSQVGALYEQVQRLRKAEDVSIKTPRNWPDGHSGEYAASQEHSGQQPMTPHKAASMPIRAAAVRPHQQRRKSFIGGRAHRDASQLSMIPHVYFDEDFHLENPRTFHVVTERSEVVPQNRTTSPQQNQYEQAPGKALATNAILQEKLSWYMDNVEVHLIQSISMASTEFFSALSSLQELHTEVAESVKNIRALREMLTSLTTHSINKGLILLRKQQTLTNLQQLNSVVAQFEHITNMVTQSKSLANQGEAERALAEIDAIELMISGECDETTGPAAMMDVQLRSLRGSVALQGIIGDLDVLRSQIGKSFESKLHDVLLEDLQRHAQSVSTLEVLTRWGFTLQRAKSSHPQEPLNAAAYMLMTDELRIAITPQILDLSQSKSISTAIRTYRYLVLQYIRSIVRKPLPSSTDDGESVTSALSANGGRSRTTKEKSSTLAANLRALDATDAEKLLAGIFVGVTEALRRLKTQSSVLFDLACTTQKPSANNAALISTPTSPKQASDDQISTFVILEEMHVAFDLSNLFAEAVDSSQDKIGKILRVRSEQTKNLSLAHFLRYFTLNLLFINECEAISGRPGTPLKNIVNDQVQDFVQEHGARKSRALAQGMDIDDWQVKDFTAKDEMVLNRILNSSTSDPPAWADASKVWMPVTHDDSSGAHVADKPSAGDAVSGAMIEQETFLLPQSAILCLEGVSDFLCLLSGIPSRAVDIAMSLLSFIQLFDSRCRQLILGAGALRSAGLKNITTTHLALASQAVSFIKSTIPYILEFVRRHEPVGRPSANLLSEFDKVQRGLQEHQDAIFQKLVDIMVLRAGTLSKKALETEWSKESSKDVRKYIVDLARDTSKLYKALEKYLPPQSVRLIMVPVFAGYGEQLGKAFETADPETETGRDCMIRDIEYLAYKLGKFEGFGQLDSEMKQIVKGKGI